MADGERRIPTCDQVRRMLSKAFYSELEVVRACTTRSNVGMSVKTVSSSSNLVDALAASVKIKGQERTSRSIDESARNPQTE